MWAVFSYTMNDWNTSNSFIFVLQLLLFNLKRKNKMIIDKIENAHLYKNLGDRIKKSFDYIMQTDLKNLQPGKYIFVSK
jgi:hypothetical protein